MVDIITIDFESFYTKEYSLTKMTTQEYVRSEFFECIGVGVQVNDGQPEWYSGESLGIKAFLAKFDWDNAVAVAHNAVFDSAILELIFDIHPAKWFCTMMAARPLCSPWTPNGRTNLKVVSEYLGLGQKGVEVHNNIGLRRKDFTPERLALYGEYCKQDVRLTYGVYTKLAPLLPPVEKELINLTILKYCRPQVYLDAEVLETRLGVVRAEKMLALHSVGLDDPSMLMSNPKFADALESLGVVPPTKISLRTQKETYAFSKADQEFKDLLEHPNTTVQALVAARLKHKSTIEETRLEKFLKLAQSGHPLSIPLLYYGAHTGRFSGMDGINLQNLPRGGALREAIVPPEGYKIVAGDLSQIEARIVATIAGQVDLLEVFDTGGDPYSYFASTLYRRPITKADTNERFIGKMCILGLGYGMGYEKFKASVKAIGNVDLTDKEAKRITHAYRDQFKHIPALWTLLQQAIEVMARPNAGMMRVAPVVFGHQHVKLPNGMCIHYPNLRMSEGQYVYDSPRGVRSLWGGALLENISQALAKIVLTTAEIRLASRRLRAFMQVHDELVFCVPEKHVDAITKAVTMAMSARVDWLPALPVACEVKAGDNYKECK